MKIFVSHSLGDASLINDLISKLSPYGITLLIAEHNIDLRFSITTKIENMIRQCDVALVLLTENGFNSNFVQQEIGYITSCNKPALNVVEKGIEPKISGFIFGHDYLLHDPQSPDITLERIKNILLQHWATESQRKNKEANIGLSILAGLLVLGLSGNK